MKRIHLPLLLAALLTLISCGSTRYAGAGVKISEIREFAFLKRLDAVDNRYGIFIYSRGFTTTQ